MRTTEWCSGLAIVIAIASIAVFTATVFTATPAFAAPTTVSCTTIPFKADQVGVAAADFACTLGARAGTFHFVLTRVASEASYFPVQK